MYSSPFRKGMLPTSTPIQACNYGWNSKKQNSISSYKTLHTLSPIKELRPCKRIHTNFSQIFDYDVISSSEELENKTRHEKNKDEIVKACDVSIDIPVKELHFDDSSYSLNDSHDYDTGYCSFDQNVTDNIFKDAQTEESQYFYEKILLPAYENCSSSEIPFRKNCESRHMGYSEINHSNDWISNTTSERYYKKCNLSKINIINYSQKRVDFLEELRKINCTSIISTILSHLSEEDLCKACCVNKKWQEIIFQDGKSNERRKAFIRQKYNIVTGPHKENQSSSKSGQVEREHKTAFHDIINKPDIFKQPLNVMHPRTRFESFIEEGKNLGKDAKLMKCPKCQFAAKDQNEKKCMCSNCCYTFCKKCLSPYQKSHSCSVPTVPIIIIGSKQSRKNLKRL